MCNISFMKYGSGSSNCNKIIKIERMDMYFTYAFHHKVNSHTFGVSKKTFYDCDGFLLFCFTVDHHITTVSPLTTICVVYMSHLKIEKLKSNNT